MRIAAALCRMVALPLTAQSIFLGVATGQSRALKGDISGVESIVFTADSSLLATVGFDGRVKVWDVAQGAEFEILKQTRMDTSCAQFSPDGKLLATGHREPVVILWDLKSGSALKSLPVSGPRGLFEEGEGHVGPVNSIAFSIDGTLLATGSDDTQVKIWNVAVGKEVATLEGHRSNVCKVSFHPQAKLLASASMDGTLIVWNVANLTPRHRIRVTDARPQPLEMDVQFSPDGRSIVVSVDNELKLYDTNGEIGTPVQLGQPSPKSQRLHRHELVH